MTLFRVLIGGSLEIYVRYRTDNATASAEIDSKPTADEKGAKMSSKTVRFPARAGGLLLSVALVSCGGSHSDTGSDGLSSTAFPAAQTGDSPWGKQVFRFETFGNELVWTDALKFQQGVIATGMTPVEPTSLLASRASPW